MSKKIYPLREFSKNIIRYFIMNEDWNCLGEESKDPYSQVCIEAVEDDNIFNKFKKDPRYTAILEHVSVEQGKLYAEDILDYDIDSDLISSFKENDIVGGSSLFNYSIEKEDLKYFFAFSSLFLVNILYANYDYRIPLFLPLVIILSKYVKGKFQYIFMFLMPLSIPIFESLDFVNDLIMYTGRLSFYFFYFIILRYYKNYF